MRAPRAALALLSAGIALSVGAPALAHTEVLSSGPRAGAVVAHLPSTIVLNFGEPLQRVESATVVRAGVNHARGSRVSAKNARQVRIATRRDRVGRYTVTVKVVTSDGDHQQVSYRFRVAR